MNLRDIFKISEADISWGKIDYSESIDEITKPWFDFVNEGKPLSDNDIKEDIIRREKRITNSYDFQSFHELNDVINDILSFDSEDFLSRNQLIRKIKFLDYIQVSISGNYENYKEIESDILKYFGVKRIKEIENKSYRVNNLDEWIDINPATKMVTVNALRIFSINDLSTVEKANLMLLVTHAIQKDNVIEFRDILNTTGKDDIDSLPVTLEALQDLEYISEISI